MEKSIPEYEKELNQNKMLIDKLKSEKIKLEREINQNKKKIEKLEKNIPATGEYEKELNENKILIDKLKYEKAKYEKEINQNKMVIDKLEKNLPDKKQNQKELIENKIIIEKLKTEKIKLEREISQNKNLIEKLKTNKGETPDKKIDNEKEISKNKSLIDKLKSDLFRTERELNQNKILIEKLKTSQPIYEKEVNQNKILIEKLKSDKTRYEREIQKLNDQLKYNKNKISFPSPNINTVNLTRKNITETTTYTCNTYENKRQYSSGYKDNNTNNNNNYLISQKEREIKYLTEKVIKLEKEIDNNKQMYNDRINNLNDQLNQKNKQYQVLRNENYSIRENLKENIRYGRDTKCTCGCICGIFDIEIKNKSFSQEKTIKKYSNYAEKTVKYINNKYSSKDENEKIEYLNECLQEKEDELNYLTKCLEQKEKELKIYVEKNSKKVYKNKSNDTNVIIKEKELYEQIEIYETEIENKNKEISLLKRRIRNLVIYLKRKDYNILRLDNELRIIEKENEEIRIDNEFLANENKKLEKINERLLNKKECQCDIGIERYCEVVDKQKKENEDLRNRFNNLYKELDEYRRRNMTLTDELNKLQKESSIIYNYDMERNRNYSVKNLNKK